MGRDNLNPQIIILKQNDKGEFFVLLVRRVDAGVWTLPGGRIENGETLREAAFREALEETGCTIEITRELGTYTLPKIPELGRVFIFVAKVKNEKTKKIDNKEIDKVKWFSVNGLPFTLPIYQRQRIKDAIDVKINININQNYGIIRLLLNYLFTPWVLIKILKFYSLIKKNYRKRLTH